MARKIVWLSLALTPLVLVVHYGFGVSGTPTFILSALALAPLAFLIGEATEQIAEHTGPGVSAFLNASFGNAPELIIALFAIGAGLPDVVRGSLAGSVVGTALLVFGAAIAVADGGDTDRRSLLLQAATVAAAVLLFLVPSVPGWHGDIGRHSLYVLTVPVAAVLLLVYVAITWHNLRVHRASHSTSPSDEAWRLPTSLGVLAVATAATAIVSELLVHSLDAFGRALGLSQFFVAVVIVAIVGNAAEHGGAVVTARRGDPRLGSEIAISSAMQVAVFIAPAVALLSVFVGHDLALTFRPVEIAAMGGSAVAAMLVVLNGRTTRREGYLLLALYAIAVVAFGFAGDR